MTTQTDAQRRLGRLMLADDDRLIALIEESQEVGVATSQRLGDAVQRDVPVTLTPDEASAVLTLILALGRVVGSDE